MEIKNVGYKALIFALLLILLVGGLVPSMINAFVEPETYNNEGYLISIIEFIREGFNVAVNLPIPIFPDIDFDFNMNPFSLLGGTIQNFLANQLTAFQLIPAVIGIPLIILIVVSLLYGIAKTLSPFSS